MGNTPTPQGPLVLATTENGEASRKRKQDDDLGSLQRKDIDVNSPRYMIKREVIEKMRKGVPMRKLLSKIGVHFTVRHISGTTAALTDRDLLRRFKRFIDSTDAENIEVLLSNLSIYDALEKYKRRKPNLPNTGDPINDVVQLFRTSNRVMVVSGAGISVSCGVPDFRSPGGLYERIRREMDLTDPQAIFDFDLFRSDPNPFYSICKDLFPKESLNPSPSHYFIKLLEEKEKLLRNYTQNIDTLECKAGIKRVMHCHGSFATASCIQCTHRVDCSSIRDQVLSGQIPRCSNCSHEKNVMKPDIVFFNEPLSKNFDLLLDRDLDDVDLLVVMGSSLRVQPVSIIPEEVRDANSEVPQILINRELVGESDQFDYFLRGECDSIITEICKRIGWEIPCTPSTATVPTATVPAFAPTPPAATVNSLASTPTIPTTTAIPAFAQTTSAVSAAAAPAPSTNAPYASSTSNPPTAGSLVTSSSCNTVNFPSTPKKETWSQSSALSSFSSFSSVATAAISPRTSSSSASLSTNLSRPSPENTVKMEDEKRNSSASLLSLPSACGMDVVSSTPSVSPISPNGMDIVSTVSAPPSSSSSMDSTPFLPLELSSTSATLSAPLPSPASATSATTRP